MAESAGEMPTRNFMNPAGWWAELTEHEVCQASGADHVLTCLSVPNSQVSSFWSCITSYQSPCACMSHPLSVLTDNHTSMTMTTGDISYVIIGCHFTW